MKLNGSTIGKTREDLVYEKTMLLAELDRDTYTGELSEADRRHHRKRVVQIQNQLRVWT